MFEPRRRQGEWALTFFSAFGVFFGTAGFTFLLFSWSAWAVLSVGLVEMLLAAAVLAAAFLPAPLRGLFAAVFAGGVIGTVAASWTLVGQGGGFD
jgi:hypothetical protein